MLFIGLLNLNPFAYQTKEQKIKNKLRLMEYTYIVCQTESTKKKECMYIV